MFEPMTKNVVLMLLAFKMSKTAAVTKPGPSSKVIATEFLIIQLLKTPRASYQGFSLVSLGLTGTNVAELELVDVELVVTTTEDEVVTLVEDETTTEDEVETFVEEETAKVEDEATELNGQQLLWQKFDSEQ